MRQRDRETAGALRVALSAIDNAEAVPLETAPDAGAIEMSSVGVGRMDRPRRELTEQAMRSLVANEEAELRESAERYRDADPTRADALAHAATTLRRTERNRARASGIARTRAGTRRQAGGGADC